MANQAKLQAIVTAEDQATKVFEKIKQSANSVVKGLENISSAGTNAAKKIYSASQSMGEGLSKVAKSAGTFSLAIGASFGLFTKSALEGAGKAEQLQTAFTVMTGSAETAKKTLASLTQFAATTPFQLPEVQGAAKSLLAFGVQAKDLEPTLRSLGDVSAGINAPIGEIAELFGKAKVQGRLFSQDINQLTNRGIPVIQEFAKQFKVSEDKVRGLVESGKIGFPELEKAFKSMSGQGGQFYDLMNKQSQTFLGQVSNLQDGIGQLTVELGNAMLPTMKQVASAIGELVKWFQALSPETKELIGKGILIVTGLGLVAGAIAAVSAAGAILIPIIGAIGSALLFLAANPVGILIVALGAVVAWVISTGVTWNEIVLGMQSLWLVVVQAITEKIQWLEEKWDEFLVNIGQMTPEAFEQIKRDHAQKMEQMNDDLADLGHQYGEITREKYKKAKEAAEDEIARQRDIVDGMTGDMKEAAKRNLEKMKAEYLKQYPEMRLGSSQELAKMRNIADEETKKAAEAAAKNTAEMTRKVVAAFKENASGAVTWGEHFIQNFAGGMLAKIPAIANAVALVKEKMNAIKFSTNPDIPSEIWGEHFLENFAAGMKESAPKVFEQTEELKKQLKAQYGSDGEISKLLKEWQKDKSTGEHFAQIAEQVKQEGQKITDEFNREKAEYDALNLKVGQALSDLKKKHQDALDEIGKKIDDTKAKIKDLNENYSINVQKEDTGLGGEVVKQQDLVAELKKQIAEKQAEYTKMLAEQQTNGNTGSSSDDTRLKAEQEIKDLQDKYNKEYTALGTFMANAKGLEDEIAEARRRTNLTDFERFIEDTNNRKAALQKEYEEKLALLEQEKASLQDQRDKENLIYTAKMQQFALVQTSFKQMQNTFTTGLSNMQTVAQQKVTQINSLLAQMKSAMDQMGLLSNNGPAAAPITQQNVKKFAVGGVVESPTLAMIGEGGMNEAVVPLPNGRSIPVQFSGNTGNGGKQITVNMNFGDVNIAKEVDAENFFSKMEERLTRAIQLQGLGSLA